MSKHKPFISDDKTGTRVLVRGDAKAARGKKKPTLRESGTLRRDPFPGRAGGKSGKCSPETPKAKPKCLDSEPLYFIWL